MKTVRCALCLSATLSICVCILSEGSATFHSCTCICNLAMLCTLQECDNEVLRAAPESVQWLARLALTRSTVIMPMTNSIGYHKTVRYDGSRPGRITRNSLSGTT